MLRGLGTELRLKATSSRAKLEASSPSPKTQGLYQPHTRRMPPSFPNGLFATSLARTSIIALLLLWAPAPARAAPDLKLKAYVSALAYLREAVQAYKLGEPSERGIF